MSTVRWLLYPLCSLFLVVTSYKDAIPWIKTYERVLFYSKGSHSSSSHQGVIRAQVSLVGDLHFTMTLDSLSNSEGEKSSYSVVGRIDSSYFPHSDNETVIMHNQHDDPNATTVTPTYVISKGHYTGKVENHIEKTQGMLRGLFFQSSSVFHGDITINNTRYYIESKHKYCRYLKLRDELGCDNDAFNAIMYKESDLNLTRVFEEACEDLGLNCYSQSDTYIQKIKSTIQERNSSEDVRRAAERNEPRSCRIEVIIHDSVQSLFDDDHNFVIAKIREYVDAASDIFRNQDFNQDGYPDQLRINPVRFRYLNTSDAFHFIPPTVRGQDTDQWNLFNYAHDWLRRYSFQRAESEPYSICAVIAFVKQSTRGFHFTYSYKLVDNMKNLSAVCRDKPIEGSVYNVGVVSLSKDDVPLPDRVVTLGLVHLLGHIFGAEHDEDHEESESLGCIPRDAAEKGNYLMHSIPVDGSMPNHVMFSECSLRTIYQVLTKVEKDCLELESYSTCGNGYKEPWEECDCIDSPKSECIPSITLCCRKEDGIGKRWLHDDRCSLELIGDEGNETRNVRCVAKDHCCSRDCKGILVGKTCSSHVNDWPDWSEEIQNCRNYTFGFCMGNHVRCMPSLRQEGYPCAAGRTCAFDGKCNSNICADHVGDTKLEACDDCPEGDDRCVVCCKIPSTRKCRPYKDLPLRLGYDLPSPLRNLAVNKAYGSVCAKDSLICDGEGKCKDIQMTTSSTVSTTQSSSGPGSRTLDLTSEKETDAATDAVTPKPETDDITEQERKSTISTGERRFSTTVDRFETENVTHTIEDARRQRTIITSGSDHRVVCDRLLPFRLAVILWIYSFIF